MNGPWVGVEIAVKEHRTADAWDESFCLLYAMAVGL